jgi:hypothetical protein
MITLDELLNEGPLLVKGKVTGRIFMVSAIRGTGGVIGVAPYDEGRPRPTDGEHLMLSAEKRDEYFQKLDRL